MSKELILSKADYILLTNFIRNNVNRKIDNNIQKIANELSKAKVVEVAKFPKNLVKLNSKINLLEIENSNRLILTLVMPEEIDIMNGKISVFAPLSIALFGCREGEEIELVTAIGARRYRIERVMNN